MGKGGRSHASRYRIVVHSKEYYKKQREIKHRREQAKAIREGFIFTDIPDKPKVAAIIGDKVVVS